MADSIETQCNGWTIAERMDTNALEWHRVVKKCENLATGKTCYMTACDRELRSPCVPNKNTRRTTCSGCA